MRKILILLFILISATLSATTYYVSTSGSDSNNGLTTSTPWLTLQYAEAHATAPGDIIAMKKGDVWSLTTTVVIKHGGASGNPVTWDGSLWGSGANAKILVANNRTDNNYAAVHFITAGCAYVTFKNTIVDCNNKATMGVVIGYHQAISNNKQNNEHDIIIDGCSILNVGNGSAYNQAFICKTWYNDIWNITIQNCTLDGSDDEQLAFYGARSDEGWDQIPAECRNVTIRNNTLTNWGRRGQSTGYGLQINNKITNVLIEGNTLTQGPSGIGDAFHIESNEPNTSFYPTGVVVRYNKITVSRPNEWNVIIQQGRAKTVDMYSNIFIHTATNNTTGGNIWIISSSSPSYSGAHINFYNNTFYTRTGRTFEDDSNLPGICGFKNNIVYHAGTLSTDYPIIINVAGSTVHSNNLYYRVGTGDIFLLKEGGSNKYQSTIQSWEPTSKKDDPLFNNLSGYDLSLQSGSCASSSGTNLSLPADFAGNLWHNPPSMGALEASGAPPAPVVPVYVSSVIQNATPSNLEMTYNSSLTGIIPATSAFNVMVNSASRTVNSVAVSGTKVTLTLATPVVYGDVVKVSYTKPAINPLQTVSGGQAASISSQAVTNNITAPAQPAYVSSVIQNATPSSLEMTYNSALANIVPAASSFGVVVNSAARTVSSVAVSGTKVTLTLGSPVVYGDVVTVSYTKPATNPLQSSAGTQASSITAQSVTNNLAAPVNNGTPAKITMTITPNPVHHILNIQLVYTSSSTGQPAAVSPEILRIFDTSGNMRLEKLITTGALNTRVSINLRSGIYSAVLYSGGIQMATQRIIVYK